MQYQEASEILAQHGQSQILRFWDSLKEEDKECLLKQISDLDFNSIAKMRNLLEQRDVEARSPQTGEMTPAPVSELHGEAHDAAARIGSFEIRNGRVAAIVVAGGQGSRLGYDGPKGCYPIGPVSNAPLFYFHARKLLGLGKEWGSTIPLYVMTSQTNDAETRKFFKDNAYFGLNPNDVFFFSQRMWPALTPEGEIILEEPARIFLSPDGHGGTLTALDKSGALADMKKRGITTVFYFQVDNPLVEVADPAFIGFHLQNLADISIKVCAKRSPEEGLGVAVERDGKIEIVEYTEFTAEQKNERTPSGELRYKYGSVAIHVFSTAFLEREAKAGLPIHLAFKKVPYCDDNGKTVAPSKPNAYKFEKFIFDTLADSKATCCLAFDRADEFAPVKNAEGNDSPATCKAALVAKWARWLEACGVKIPRGADGAPLHNIEIDPAFAHSEHALKLRLASSKIKIDTSKDILLS